MVKSIARVMGSLQFVAALVSLLLRGPNTLGFVLVGFGPMVFATPLLLRPGWSTFPAATVLLLLNFASVASIAWLGYGPLSPATTVMVLFPVSAFVLGGSRLGVPITLLAHAQLGALWWAHQRGRVFPLSTEDPLFLTMHVLTLCSILFVILIFLRRYEAAWRDVLERSNQALEQLGIARDEALAADGSKSRFLANMSHELRTPLNAILGYSELLLDEQMGEEEAQDIERIHTAGAHLLALVDQLLDLAKIENGKVELHLERFPLAPVAEKLVSSLHPLVGKEVVLRVEVPPDLMIHTDPLRLQQILLNLVSNALKFTERGEVLVEAHPGVQIVVTDTGIGMSASQLNRCFEPFEQAISGVKGGTGLGLAITRRLVEQMGGSIKATSAVGEGSRFVIELPDLEDSTGA